MNLRSVAANTSMLLALLGLLLLVPFGLAAWQGLPSTMIAYGSSGALTLMLAVLLRWLGKGATGELHRKDALGSVALTWVALGFLGGLPLVLEGAISDPIAALFEAVSGFTTTGATVVADVDGLSDPTNLWRCLMHWIGGMGIVVLFVAIFPQIGVSAKQLFRSEAPGPVSEGLRPRIKQTAFALWLVYTGLTVLCGLLLWAAGMPVYDAVCHAFSTLGTGGFSTRGASIGYYQNPLIEWIIALFMLVAALNFGLFYAVLRGHPRDLFRNTELRFYLLVNVLVVGVLFVAILPQHDDPLETLRHAIFQTLAVTTTTGFMTEDFDTYPDIARYVLFIAMFMGGCAGSTAGGIKAVRVLVLIKLAFRELRQTLQPQAILPVRLGKTVFDDAVLRRILVFTAAFILLWVGASGFLVLQGLDLLSAMSASIACLASIGPGLEQVGPSQNFMFIPSAGKVVLCVCMIAGRLEIFALFAVFHPECWRRG